MRTQQSIETGLRLAVALPLVFAALSAASAGSLDRAIRELDRGEVTFQYEAREDVWGDGHDITFHRSDRDDDWRWDRDEWRNGPVHVALRVRDGEVRDIDVRVGRGWRFAGDRTTDLGEIPPCEAADFFLALARDARSEVAEDAVMPAVMARGCETWPTLLGLARDRQRDEDVREQALFWLGQLAGEKVTAELVTLVDDDDEDLEIREHAIFALSQQDEDVSIPALVKVARSSRHPQLREQALFWLGQIDDERVLDLFEEILLED